MLRLLARLPALYLVGLFFLFLSFGNGQKAVLAITYQSSGSVVIAAVVAPVREVLVDSHGNILQILSNTPQAVTPTIYLGNFKSSPIALTQHISIQYAQVIARCDTKRTGLIYRAEPKTNSKLFVNSLRF